MQESQLKKVAWNETKVIAALQNAFGERAGPRGRAAFEANNRHVRGDAPGNPTAELRRSSRVSKNTWRESEVARQRRGGMGGRFSDRVGNADTSQEFCHVGSLWPLETNAFRGRCPVLLHWSRCSSPPLLLGISLSLSCLP